MEALLRLHTGMPETLEQAVDFSMLVQADALQCAVEHYRRNMPLNAGALVWQLNDSWPCHSWSVIDYDLIPKAAYYALRRAFAPISVLLYPLNEDQTEICVSNTTSSAFSGNVNVSVSSVLGTCVHAETLHAQIPPYSCICLKILRVGGRFTPNIILPNRRRWYYICAKIPEIPCTETFRYFSEYKDSVLPSCTISCKSSYSPDGALHLTLCTDAFARQTRIEGDMRGLSLSDNYFDMNAGVEYQVTLHALRGAPPEKRSLSIRCAQCCAHPPAGDPF